MDPFELIRSLQEQLAHLPYRNKSQLDRLRRRAEMILSKVFGEGSKYVADARGIQFSPLARPASDETWDRAWRDGLKHFSNLLEVASEDLGLARPQTIEREVRLTRSNKIFVVHGHDTSMKEAVARVVMKLGLEPLILHEQPSQGRTLIEKFTDYSDVGFAIVVLSADDMGYLQADGASAARPRPRQNVLLELGFFIGKLGRDHVLPLRAEGDIELPSDYDGVVYTPFDPSGAWRLDLARELKACGYPVDANALL